MAYNNLIARGDVPAREETIDVVMDGLENESAARKFFREIRVGKASQRFPVLSALPMAYWVNGDTGLKQTSEMAWTNKFVTIEELAVIVPVPQNVVDDSDFDIWAEARPKVGEAIDRALDAAIFFGINAPASFPTNVTSAALAAENFAVAGTSATAEGGFFGDVDAALETVEDDGFSPSGWVMDRKAKGRFRRARNSQGDRIDRDRISANFGEIDGLPIAYTMDGMWPQPAAGGVEGVLGLVGDWQRQFVLALRKDVTYEVFREGVVQDNTGAIVYNLMQQDMIALRVTFRAGWQVANTINYANTVEAERYPAAVLQTPGLA
jgi:HK97 family phage major capsid protein